MEHSSPEITVLYHGGCHDGYFSCCFFNLFEYCCLQQQLDIKTELRSVFKKVSGVEKGNIQKVEIEDLKEETMSGEEDQISYEDFPREKAKLNTNYISYFHTKPEKAVPFLKRVKNKEMAIILDVSSKEACQTVCELFDEVYLVDHHQTALIEIIQDEKFLKKFPQLNILFTKEICASRILLQILVQNFEPFKKTFSQKFFENLAEIAELININDTTSFDHHTDKVLEFCQAVAISNSVGNFNHGPSLFGLYQYLNPKVAVTSKLGRSAVKKMRSKLDEELKKCYPVSFEYLDRKGEKQEISCIMGVSSCSYISALGNLVSIKAFEEGLDPVGIIAKPFYQRGRPTGQYRVSFRRTDMEGAKRVDLEEVAKFFGGGGHEAASGARLNSLKCFSRI